MFKTHVNINGEKFLINGKLTYSEMQSSNPKVHGLIMNARFIQAIFDDKAMPERFARFGRDKYDPEKNTEDFIKALPEWYKYGLRAFTVGLQGGGPCFTIDDLSSIYNSPYSIDGKDLDKHYVRRLDKVIRAADELGMVVIVSFLYQSQSHRFKDGKSIRNAVAAASRMLKEGGYTNVIIEVANEHTVGGFKNHPIIYSGEGMAYLIELARQESGGMLVGCSPAGGEVIKEVCEASDVIFVHGNGLSRQLFHNMIKKVRSFNLNKPIVCNEDSQCVGQMKVCFNEYVSWGYYNNLTKQEPPADWTITPGEDMFFARRMAEGIGIQLPPINFEDQYYLQGFEPNMTVNNKRWIRLASLYPETIDYVEFYRNGKLVDIAYDEPFMVNYVWNWYQEPCIISDDDKVWEAKVYLRDGRIVIKRVEL